jgi:hypothetical protein
MSGADSSPMLNDTTVARGSSLEGFDGFLKTNRFKQLVKPVNIREKIHRFILPY